MKPPVLIPAFYAVLLVLSLAVSAAQAQVEGLLVLKQPVQYVEFDYDFRNNQNSYSKGQTSSTDLHRIAPAYYINLPFAILNPDVFIGNVNARVRYEQDFFSASTGQSTENSLLNFNYGISGALFRRKPVSLSFYASNSKSWQQDEFSPGYDITTTLYGATAKYKNSLFPMTLRYDHNDNEFTQAGITRNNSYDTVSFGVTNTIKNLMTNSLSVQERWIKDSGTFTDSLQETSVSFNNYLWWNTGTRPGSLSSSLDYSKMTGTSELSSIQVTESLTQSLGKALKTGAIYGYSIQDSPTDTAHSHSGSLWINHQLYESIRTQFTILGNSNDYNFGTKENLAATGTITYQKRLPYNSNLQLQVSDSFQWNEQKLNATVRRQYNEKVKVTDLAQQYLLANTDVIGIVEVWNTDHTVRFDSPADYGLYQFGNLTYITINPAGLIHTGDTLLVTYDYNLDTDLSFASNALSFSGNLSILGNLLRISAQHTDSQQHLLSGNARYITLGGASNSSASVESTFAGNTMGIKYFTNDNSRTNQNSLFSYWRYENRIGRNNFYLALSDTLDWWGDNITGKKSTSNAINASAAITRQFTPGSNGTLQAGYLSYHGVTNQNNAFLKFTYSLQIGKLMLWLNAQSLLNDYSRNSIFNNSLNLIIRRYF